MTAARDLTRAPDADFAAELARLEAADTVCAACDAKDEALARVAALADRQEATSIRRRRLAATWMEQGRWQLADAFRQLARQSDVSAARIRTALVPGSGDRQETGDA